MLKKIFAIRDEISPAASIILPIIFIILVFIFWFFITKGSDGSIESRAIHPSILPSPKEMLDAVPSLFKPEKKLFESIEISLIRITQGFFIALVIALPLGILMGTFGRINKFFSPLVLIGAYLPIPTILPLTMAGLGIGEEQKVGFLAIASFVFLLPAIVTAVTNIDDVYLNTGYTLGATKLQVIARIIIPAALPAIFDSLRMGFGVGFTWIIMAEIVGAESGLGFILRQAQSRGGLDNSAIVYLILFVIILLAFIIDGIWRFLYRQFFPYKEKE